MSATTPSVTPTDVEAPALTTVFTPAPSCWEISVSPYDFILVHGSTVVLAELGNARPDCVPTSWGSLAETRAYYSPGICPSGYWTVSPDYEIVPPLTAGETEALCCPSGYGVGAEVVPTRLSYDTNRGGACYSILTTPTVAASWTTDLYESITYTSTSLSETLVITAPGVAVRAAASDSFVLADPTDAVIPGGSVSASGSSGDSGGGLSNTAKIGIGIGTVGVLVLLIALGVFFCLRRAKKQKQKPVAPAQHHEYPLPELQGPPGGMANRWELNQDAGYVAELQPTTYVPQGYVPQGYVPQGYVPQRYDDKYVVQRHELA